MTSGYQAVDASGFNFGKRAYRSDQDYQRIGKLIQAYNQSLQTGQGQDKLEARAALMQAASSYMMKNTLDKDQHQGRKGHIENLFLQLAKTATSDQEVTETLGDISGDLHSLSGSGADQQVHADMLLEIITRDLV